MWCKCNFWWWWLLCSIHLVNQTTTLHFALSSKPLSLLVLANGQRRVVALWRQIGHTPCVSVPISQILLSWWIWNLHRSIFQHPKCYRYFFTRGWNMKHAQMKSLSCCVVVSIIHSFSILVFSHTGCNVCLFCCGHSVPCLNDYHHTFLHSWKSKWNKFNFCWWLSCALSLTRRKCNYVVSCFDVEFN